MRRSPKPIAANYPKRKPHHYQISVLLFPLPSSPSPLPNFLSNPSPSSTGIYSPTPHSSKQITHSPILHSLISTAGINSIADLAAGGYPPLLTMSCSNESKLVEFPSITTIPWIKGFIIIILSRAPHVASVSGYDSSSSSLVGELFVKTKMTGKKREAFVSEIYQTLD
ncbi:hypothetical protein LguiB_008144 [Lonicera macranthoides]